MLGRRDDVRYPEVYELLLVTGVIVDHGELASFIEQPQHRGAANAPISAHDHVSMQRVQFL